jgi:hypothetical protein
VGQSSAEGTDARGELALRYEDVAQDGRVRVEALTSSLGVVWRNRLASHPLYDACRSQGIIPILTQIVVEAAPGPFSVECTPLVEGSFAIAHTVDDHGAIDRLLLNLVTQVSAPIGRTNLRPPADAGRTASVGRVRAEHVFTRPFAPPEARKVLDPATVGGDPGERIAWADPKALLGLPDGARALDDSLVTDGVEHVFGSAHTDSNQHVNSLVYPRLFEDAVLRRLSQLGSPTSALARFIDVRFRKPSFVGDRVRISLRVYERGGRIGACGAFIDDDPQRPRVCVRVELE